MTAQQGNPSLIDNMLRRNILASLWEHRTDTVASFFRIRSCCGNFRHANMCADPGKKVDIEVACHSLLKYTKVLRISYFYKAESAQWFQGCITCTGGCFWEFGLYVAENNEILKWFALCENGPKVLFWKSQLILMKKNTDDSVYIPFFLCTALKFDKIIICLCATLSNSDAVHLIVRLPLFWTIHVLRML